MILSGSEASIFGSIGTAEGMMMVDAGNGDNGIVVD